MEEFNKWYEDHKWIVFDLKRELIEYCRSDVNVLRITCEKFIKLLIEKTTVDPFHRHFTISSFCLYVFRKLFLQPNTIGIVPPRGYRHNDRQSITALKYFKQLERTEGFSFQTCLTEEYRIGPYKLDAVDHKHKVIIEFNGCFYHAHPKCTRQHLNHPLYLNMTYEQVYERTLDRIKFIKENMPDYELRVVWECEVVIEDNTEIEIQSPISSRDALYGGRVDCLKLFEEVGTDIDQIMYLDFCSLYPTMNKRKSYPKGHPDIITKDFDYNIDVYYGVMKAKLLPPTDLFHPVLPMRINGKLQFPLCHQCAVDKSSQCNHSDNERCLLGTWCTPEIYTACREGYKLVKIYEVWHYPTQFKEGELFGNYIDMFLEIKQSSSGYPSNIITDEQKQKFIENFYEREGIRLSKIEKNNALRAISKICLNSLWGRFAMNCERNKTVYLKTYEDFISIMTDETQEVTDINMVTDDMLLLTHHPKNDFVPVYKDGNVIIASFVTCYARLELFYVLKSLGKRALYCDTDSCIFTYKEGEYVPPTGYFLGDLVNEIPNCSIIKFVATGPKNYSYLLNTGETITKCKGFSLTSTSIDKLNFESFKRALKEDIEQSITATLIKRNKLLSTLNDVTVQKQFRFTYDKRFIDRNDYFTYPYGYKNK